MKSSTKFLRVFVLLVLIFVGLVDHQNVFGLGNDGWEILNAKGLKAYRQKQYELAIQLFRDALSSLEVEMQPRSRQAMTLNNLAATHEKLGRYDEAELRYHQSLTIIEQIQGPNHPDLIPGLKNLAILHRERQQFAQAERLYQRSFNIIERVLGKQHPHLIPGLLDLAHVSQAQGEYARAEDYFVRALTIGETELPSAHHQTQSIRMQYAMLLRHLNRTEEADELERKARRDLDSPEEHQFTK